MIVKTMPSHIDCPFEDGRAPILVIIPAYNERECIQEVVSSAKEVLPHADVLVIDDGSHDDTAQQASKGGALVVSHPFNLGIGGAVQTGLKFARRMGYAFVVRMDGDGQHDPRVFPELLAVVQAGEADVSIGSRFLCDEVDMEITIFRQLGIKLFAKEVSLITRKRATDTTSGLMAMNRYAIELLARFMPQDYPEVEGRIILHTGGMVVKEIPARMRERIAGVSSINKWRSIYYAFKVSVAVLCTSMKHIPRKPKEMQDVGRATAYSSLI